MRKRTHAKSDSVGHATELTLGSTTSRLLSRTRSGPHTRVHAAPLPKNSHTQSPEQQDDALNSGSSEGLTQDKKRSQLDRSPDGWDGWRESEINRCADRHMDGLVMN